MQKLKKKKSRSQLVADNRIRLLADRAAILLVTVKGNFGDGWNPWLFERTYDDPESLGETLREWKDYKEAKDIVRLWLRRQDQRTVAELEQ